MAMPFGSSRPSARRPTKPSFPHGRRPPGGQRRARLEPLEPRLLLSADLQFTALADADLTLRIVESEGVETLQLVDSLDPAVIRASQELASSGGAARTDAHIDAGGFDVRLLIDAGVADRLSGRVYFDGGPGDSVLAVAGEGATWSLTREDGGIVGDVWFTGVDRVVGGEGDDRFLFWGRSRFAGRIDGGGGHDVADYSQRAEDQIVRLADLDAVEEVLGGGGWDTLTGLEIDAVWSLAGPGQGSVGDVAFDGIESIEAGGGADTLRGPGDDATWTLTGLDAGHVAGTTFAGVEYLIGAADNRDTFVFAAGGALSGSLHGGAGGFDSLLIEGGTYSRVVYRAEGPHSGSIELDGVVLAYDGLEPVTDMSVTDERLFEATAGDDEIRLLDAGGGQSILLSDNGTFESVTFMNPAISLTIAALGGTDLVTLDALDPAFAGQVIVDGGEGTDTVAAKRDADFTLSDGELGIGSRLFQLVDLEVAELTGGGGANTFVVDWSRDATLQGLAGIDVFTVAAVAGAMIDVDGGSASDVLEVTGTGAGDDFLVDPSSIAVAGGSVLFTDIGSLVLTGAGGEDMFSVVGLPATGIQVDGDDEQDVLRIDGEGASFSAAPGMVTVSGRAPVLFGPTTEDVRVENVDAGSVALDGPALAAGLEALAALGADLPGAGELAGTVPFTAFSFGDLWDPGALLGALSSGVGALPAPMAADVLAYLTATWDGSSIAPAAGLEALGPLVVGAVTAELREVLVAPDGTLSPVFQVRFETARESSVPLSLGLDARNLGLVLAGAVPGVEVSSGMTFDLDLGVQNASAGAPAEFFLELSELSGVVRIADPGDPGLPLALPGFDLNVGVLGTTVAGATLDLDARVDLSLADAIAGDGRVTAVELTGAAAAGHVLESPAGTAHGVLPASIHAGLEAGDVPGSGADTIVLGSATENLFGYPRQLDAISQAGDVAVRTVGPPVTLSPDVAAFGNLTPHDLVLPILQLTAFVDDLGGSSIFREGLPFVDDVALQRIFGASDPLDPAVGLGAALRQRLLSHRIDAPDQPTAFHLTARAELRLTVDGQSVDVSLEAADTADNEDLSDLVHDLNAALGAALAAELGAEGALRVQATFLTEAGGGRRLRLFSDRPFSMRPTSTPTSAELGFAAGNVQAEPPVVLAGAAAFETIQELLARVPAGVLSAAYDAASGELTFDVHVDSEQPGIDVPFALNVDLGPLSRLDVGATVELTPEVGLHLTYGVDLKPDGDVPELLSSDAATLPADGRVPGDQMNFRLVIDDLSPVSVAVGGLADNASLADLVDDLNAALAGALAGAGLDADGVTASLEAGRLRLALEPDGAHTMLRLLADADDPIVAALGFDKGQVALASELDDFFVEESSRVTAGLAMDLAATGVHGRYGFLGVDFDDADLAGAFSAELAPADPLGNGDGRVALPDLVVRPAVVRAEDPVSPANGRLTAPAGFRLLIGGAAPIDVRVDDADTASNAGIADLVADLNEAIGSALLDAGLRESLVRAGLKGGVLVLVLDSVHEKLEIQVTPGDPAETELGFAPGSSSSEDTLVARVSVKHVDGGVPLVTEELVPAGLPVVAPPVLGGALDGHPGLQLLLDLDGAVAGHAVAFDVDVTATDLLDPASLTVAVASPASLLADRLRAEEAVELVRGAGDFLFSVYLDVDLLQGPLPLVRLSATDLSNFVAPVLDLLGQLDAQEPPETLQDLERLVQQILGSAATRFSLSGDRLGLDVEFVHGETVSVPLALALERLSGLAVGGPPLTNPGTLASADAAFRYDVSSRARVDLALALDLGAAAPALLLSDVSSVEIDVRALADDLLLPATYAGQPLSIVAGLVRLGRPEGEGQPARYAVGLTASPGGERALEDVLDLEDLDDAADGVVTAGLTGDAGALLRLETPGNPAFGDLALVIPDLEAALSGAPGSVEFLETPPLDDLRDPGGPGDPQNRLELLLRNPDLLVGGLDGMINDVQTVIELTLEPLGMIPVVGDILIDPILDLFQDFREARTRLRNQLIVASRDEGVDMVDAVQGMLFQAFGPSGIGVLLDRFPHNDGAVTEDDVLVLPCDEPLALCENAPDDDFVQWDMHLGQELVLGPYPFEFGLGLQDLPFLNEGFPNFGFDLSADEGVILKFAWDMYLGIGVSLQKGFYLNAEEVTDEGDPTSEIDLSFEATVPGLAGRLGFGLIQSEFTDGTTPRVSLVAPGSIIPGEDDGGFLDLSVLRSDWAVHLTLVEETEGGANHQYVIDYDSGTDIDFLSFLRDLNLELLNATGSRFIATADFGDPTHPRLMFTARQTDTASLTVVGGEASGFLANQHEDQRSRGLGFENGQTSTPDGSGEHELLAEREAPTGGRIVADTDLVLVVGGQEVPVVLRSELHEDVESLADLRDAVQSRIDGALGQLGNPVKATRVEIAGERLRFVSDQPLSIQDIPEMDETILRLGLGVDLVDPGDDGRLDLNEMASASLFQVLRPSPVGEAQFRLNVDANTDHITEAFGTLLDDVVGDVLDFLFDADTLALPSLNFDLIVDVGLGSNLGPLGVGLKAGDRVLGKSNQRLAQAGRFIKKFQFDNIQLDIGELATTLLQPVATAIDHTLGPLADLLGSATDFGQSFLEEPFPLLDELGLDLSLMDVLDRIGVGGGIRELRNIVTLVETIESSISQLAGTGQVDVGCLELIFDPLNPLYFPRTFIPVPCEVAAGLESLGLPNLPTAEFESTTEPSGFRLDLLSLDSVLNWLMGEPFDIFSFNLPEANVGGHIRIPFGLKVDDYEIGFDITTDVGVHADMGIVYDSTGIQRIIEAENAGAEPDLADLLDGFYVRNEPGAEFSLEASFEGSGGVGPIELDLLLETITLFEAEGHVEASLFAGLDLKDPNEDGKLRLDEVLAVTDNFNSPQNLIGLFDITLNISGGFGFSVTLLDVTLDSDDLGIPTGFELDLSLAEIFGFADFSRDAARVLAEVVELEIPGAAPESASMERVLRLNTGPFDHSRIVGDTDDSDGVVYNITGSRSNLLINGIPVGDLTGVTRIVGFGSDADDAFIFASSVDIPVEIDGRGGNDTIRGGNADDTLRGGLGDDDIEGRAGADLVDGGRGVDDLEGNGGPDTVIGGEGDDALTGGGDDDVYRFEGDWGSDTIFEVVGGGARDVIDMSGVRRSLEIVMSAFGTTVTDFTNFLTLANADPTPEDHPGRHRIEKIIGGSRDDLFLISATEPNIDGNGDLDFDDPEDARFETTLDGSEGSDIYRLFFGDPRSIPDFGPHVFATNFPDPPASESAGSLLDPDAIFFVVVEDSEEIEVVVPRGDPGETPEDLLGRLSQVLSDALTAAGLSGGALVAELRSSGDELAFRAPGDELFAVYAKDATNPATTQLGIEAIIDKNLLGDLFLMDSGAPLVDIDRLLADGSQSADIVGLTDQMITVRRDTEPESLTRTIRYAGEGGGSGIEVMQFRLRSGGDVISVESTPGDSSVLLQGQGGDDTFNIGVIQSSPERRHLTGPQVYGPLTDDPSGVLSAAATFVLEVGFHDPVTVTVAPDAANAGLGDLAADVNAAVQDALTAAGLGAGLVSVSHVTDANGVDRLRFDSAETLAVYALPSAAPESTAGHPAVDELGLPLAHNLNQMAGSELNGPLLVEGGFGVANVLNVFDTSDELPDVGLLTERKIRGLGMDQGIDYEDLQELHLFLGRAGDILNIESIRIGTPTSVRARGGGDVVNVSSILGLDLDAPDGTGVLDDIDDALLVVGGAGHDTMNASDAGEAVDAADGDDDEGVGTLTQTHLFGLELAPAGIEYHALELLNIDLGAEDDRFNVQGTLPVTNLAAAVGDDVIYVSSGAELAALRGYAPADGDLAALHDALLHGTLDRVAGELNIDAGAGRNTLGVSDRQDADGDAAVVITASTLRGLAPGDISYVATGGDFSGQGAWASRADVGLFGRGINIYGGSGGNVYAIESVLGTDGLDAPFGRTLTTLFAGEGSDTVSISVADDPDALLAVRGQGGGDVIDAAPATGVPSPSTLPLILLGDGGGDAITAGAAPDVVLGDGGRVYFRVPDGLADAFDIVLGGAPAASHGAGPLDDDDFLTPDLILSLRGADGGADRVEGGAADDLVLGGALGDTLFGDSGALPPAESGGLLDGDDILIGDEGRIELRNGAARRVQTVDPAAGGSDTVSGNGGRDILLGGAEGDTLHGDAATPGSIDSGDILLGDNGEVVLADAGNVQRAFTTNSGIGGSDTISGDAGRDLVLGGGSGDDIHGDADGDWLVGDHATVEVRSRTVRRIEILDRFEGGADTVLGGGGQDVILGGTRGDVLDGGAADDLILGDNALLDRLSRFGDHRSPLFRALEDGLIYGDRGQALVDLTREFPHPTRNRSWGDFDLVLERPSLAAEGPGASSFGDDYIAGGAADDLIFGQLGHDVIQGDGSVGGLLESGVGVGATRDGDGLLVVTPSTPADTDGDDTIEGNGGNDTVFGGLGQDDIIGGSSDQFGLESPADRPDGADMLFGGAGTTDRDPGDPGDGSSRGHARDADLILGDNGNIFRLVAGDAEGLSYLTFNYDDYDPSLRIIPRAAVLLDYTPGGADIDPDLDDIGAADEIHGEAGDDSLYGMLGNDILFGEGQDDDAIGGSGHDWITGGTGDDGVLGDDGRIFTSRNDDQQGEPLYGIAPVSQGIIRTPGNIQRAEINLQGKLKKTVDLEPFSVGLLPSDDAVLTPSDDILYGGLGNDSLHGGLGDDAISGAESLPRVAATLVERDGDDVTLTRFLTGYLTPGAPGSGDVLAFGTNRAGEFFFYDEFQPFRRILVNEDGTPVMEAGPQEPLEFLLNFLAGDGPQVDARDGIHSDGDDVAFGDLGNDWLVGGTGNDRLYGGRGSDLMNADDDHRTAGGENTEPDTHETYADTAYGGAGRDVLIANTGLDRLIDWVGEFNSYLVPFAPFGEFTVSRSLMPHLMEWLYDLSEGDGADPTRDADGAPDRNGEPHGELGLVLQKDADWKDQTGAPDDIQAGNIPGGKRDLVRLANFNSGEAEGFTPDSGQWSVQRGRFEVAPETLGGDAVSVFYVNHMLPGYFEMTATVNADKDRAGYKSNAFLIFDYQSPTDFKFAGINAAIDKLQIGHRNAEGWFVDVQAVMQVWHNVDYNVLLALNGTTATLVVDGTHSLSHAFEARVDEDGFHYGLNAGMVGVGADNSRGRFDNVAVQVLPPEITFERTLDFAAGSAGVLDGESAGDWAVVEGRLEAIPSPGEDRAVRMVELGLDQGLNQASVLQLGASVRAVSMAGLVFDHYGPDDFKFAAILPDSGQVAIGHFTRQAGWVLDAVVQRALDPALDHELALTVKGTTVSLSVDGQLAVGHAFNALLVDGDFGLLAGEGGASFDSFTIKTDDASLRGRRFGGRNAGEATEEQAVADAAAGESESVELQDADALREALRFDSWTLGRLDPRGWSDDWVVDVRDDADDDWVLGVE